MSAERMPVVEPVRRSVVVGCPPQRAWALFTDGIATWWPLATHSLGEERAVTCTLEARAGGRIFERLDDGSERDWGTVTACEPPRRLVVCWSLVPGRAATEWEVRFQADGAGTRVELEHRGWEALGADAVQLRENYHGGWEAVLGCYAGRVAQASSPAR